MNKIYYKHFGIAFLVSMVLRVVLPKFAVNNTDVVLTETILGLVAFISFIAMIVSLIFEIIRNQKNPNKKPAQNTAIQDTSPTPNTSNKMKKNIPWQYILTGGVLASFIGALIGGVIGDSINLLGFILILIGLINCIRYILDRTNSHPGLKIIYMVIAIVSILAILIISNKIRDNVKGDYSSSAPKSSVAIDNTPNDHIYQSVTPTTNNTEIEDLKKQIEQLKTEPITTKITPKPATTEQPTNKTLDLNALKKLAQESNTQPNTLSIQQRCLSSGLAMVEQTEKKKDEIESQYHLNTNDRIRLSNQRLQDYSDNLYMVRLICGTVSTEDQMIHELQKINDSLNKFLN